MGLPANRGQLVKLFSPRQRSLPGGVALTALAGVEAIVALFVAHKTSSFTVTATDFWLFSALIVVGVGATFVFIFPAGLPLFAPAAVAILRKPSTEVEEASAEPSKGETVIR